MENTAQIELQPDLPERSGVPAAPVTDLRREYAVAGSRSWIVDVQTLSQYEDEVLAELGTDAYAQAANDPVIESAVEDLVMSATSDEPMFRPVFPEGHDRHDEAVQAAEFCERLWQGISNEPQDTLEQLGRGAAYYGHCVAEQTFEPASARDAGKYSIKYWKALPRESTAFVVDRYMNVLGMLAARSGRSVSVGGTLYSNAEVIDRRKFTVLTLRGDGADPRGRSLVRSAMTARGIKRQVLCKWVQFLDQKSQVIPIGIAGENSDYEQPIDPKTGKPVADADPVSAPEAMAQKLALLRSHEAIGLSHGSDVKTLDMQGDSALFLSALEWLDLQITRGILLQVLSTSDAKNGSRAQASVHENVKDLLTFWLKQKKARVIRRDLMRPAMLVNFGADAARELTPIITMGDYDRKDWADTADSWATLVNTNDMDEAQLSQGWAEIGFPRGPEGTPKPLRAAAVVPSVPVQEPPALAAAAG